MNNSGGWRSRGYLPHFDSPELIQMLTFRLADSIPQHKIEAWKNDPRCRSASNLHNVVHNFLDMGYGECWLKHPDVGAAVQNSLLYFDGVRYRLLRWCVMPNHVHVIVEVNDGFALEEVVHSWKSFTANRANRLLGRTGAFWQIEYFDRYIRSEQHLNRALHYIDQNPVKAGLVPEASEWPLGSAGFQPTN